MMIFTPSSHATSNNAKIDITGRFQMAAVCFHNRKYLISAVDYWGWETANKNVKAAVQVKKK